MHLFWDCDVLKHFWDSIHALTKAVLDIEISLNPCFFLLNDMANFKLNPKHYRILITITYFAKKCILLFWKNERPPTFKLFIDQITHFLPLEKMTLEKYNRGHIFQALWLPLFSYLENISEIWPVMEWCILWLFVLTAGNTCYGVVIVYIVTVLYNYLYCIIICLFYLSGFYFIYFLFIYFLVLFFPFPFYVYFHGSFV